MVELAYSLPIRKIVYPVHANSKTDNLEETIYDIRHSLENEEWFAEKNITSISASFIVRVKSTRIDDFITSIKMGITLRDYSL